MFNRSINRPYTPADTPRASISFARTLLGFLLLFAVATFPDNSSGQSPPNPAYNVTGLGHLGGGSSQAFGINNAGQVVGRSFTTGGDLHATLFGGNGTGNIDLGTLGGSWSTAWSINDSGQIVGEATLAAGNLRATRFSGTGTGNVNLGNLGAPPIGDGGSIAYSINNIGQIVGYSIGTSGFERATLFSGTGTGNVDLGTLGGTSSRAHAINDSGQIVGFTANSPGIFRATLFGVGGASNFDLGTLGGPSSQAFDISETGLIVGHSGTLNNGPTHAALFSGTGSNNSDLGTLGGTTSRAYAVNNGGHIVGNAPVLPGNVSAGFIYSNTVMSNLNSLLGNNPGFVDITVSTLGHTINDWGQIAANAAGSGIGQAVRLDPINPLSYVSNGGASRNIKFVGGMNYNQFTMMTNPGGLGTTANLLDGIVGDGGMGLFGLNRDVDFSFLPPNPILPASDIVSLVGMEGDTFVLQLIYDEDLVNGLLGDESQARLGWSNGGSWELAVDGNTGGSPLFVLGPWNSSYGLGTYGVDTSANTVWGVLNHNSEFAVWGAQAIPEPSSVLVIVGFTFAVILNRRRAGQNRAALFA